MGIFDFLKPKTRTKKAANKVVLIDDVEYKYVKSKSSKSLKITVKDRFHIRVSMPYYLSYKDAETFVFKKQSWIEKTLEQYEFNLIDENFKTKTNNLVIKPSLVLEPVIKTKQGTVYFLYPFNSNFYSKENQEKLKQALKKALYMEAKDYLPKRLNELAHKYNFKYNKLSLKTHKTRWGSCSGVNNINLNINLMLLDNEFIDYVLLHELCHTVEKNHKENFWKLLYKLMPEAEILKRKLKTKTPLI